MSSTPCVLCWFRGRVGPDGNRAGAYTFGAHLKGTPLIAVGYTLSILVHLWLNSALM
jgi:hypothetical protein